MVGWFGGEMGKLIQYFKLFVPIFVLNLFPQFFQKKNLTLFVIFLPHFCLILIIFFKTFFKHFWNWSGGEICWTQGLPGFRIFLALQVYFTIFELRIVPDQKKMSDILVLRMKVLEATDKDLTDFVLIKLSSHLNSLCCSAWQKEGG